MSARDSARGTARKNKNTRACLRCEFRFDESRAQCPSCFMWNPPKVTLLNGNSDQTVLLSEVSPNPIARIETGPWDTCFGTDTTTGKSGIVTTSVTLIGGAPGAGKSTMSLQLADQVAENTNREIIYVGSEESPEQIRDRATRLQLKRPHLIRLHPMGSSVDLGNILLKRKPSAIILDSLPGLTSDPEMAVELCKRFKDYSVELNAPTIIIDHVTKDGDLAGLMALQHAVDTLLTLFPVDGAMRELETVKNRFGRAQISVPLVMTERGLFIPNSGNDDEEYDDEYDDESEDE